MIALGAIWANKLRSFLTVLGNIVAVTSIIAVVSLVQGMNEYVTTAILSGVGADNFTIQRMPVVRTEADEERVRNNPRIKLEEAAAVRRYSDNVGAVAAQAQSRATMAYGSQSVDGAQVQGVSRDYVYFGTFNAEHGRLISQAEIDANRPVAVLGWEVADKLFGPADPIDKSSRSAVSISAWSGSAKRRDPSSAIRRTTSRSSRSACFARCSARARSGCSCSSSRRTPELVKTAMDDATVAMRIERRLRPRRAG